MYSEADSFDWISDEKETCLLFSVEVMITLDQAEPVKFRAMEWVVSPGRYWLDMESSSSSTQQTIIGLLSKFRDLSKNRIKDFTG